MEELNLRLDDIDIDFQDSSITELNITRYSKDESFGPKAVAIIGMDGKAGANENLEQLWQMLISGREGVRDLPEQRRKDVLSYLSARGIKYEQASLDKLFMRGTYLSDISQFDYGFFELSKQEANFMDPNQRLFLETVWHALEDAGYGGKEIRGSDTGVFVGFSSDFGDEYRSMLNVLSPDAPEVAVSGNVKSIIASRIAYQLDLRGPAVMVDTACSSGLMAMYLAMRAIQREECSMAIAGAVKMQTLPILADSKNGFGIRSIQDIVASDSHTRTFDSASDGTYAAEGVFAYVLKSLEEAVRDGDTIRAVILGGAANQDGASNGITSPNSKAQEELIVQALQDADIYADELSYIEAHGTATKLGDPVEISGIQRALSQYSNKKQYCAVGSLKSNIGHLDNAAGLGAVAKVVLSMKNRVLPASINFKMPNHNIPFVESPVYVNDRTVTWGTINEEKLFAGINSFGLSGTNCHLVLSSAPILSTDDREPSTHLKMLPLSAKTPQALRLLAAAYQKHLSDPNVNVDDAVYTAGRGRVHHHIRLAICFKTREQLCTSLGRFFALGADALTDEALAYGEHDNANKDKLNAQAVTLLHSTTEYVSTEVIQQLAELYVAGADLDFSQLTQGMEVRRIPLPTYPFQRSRCWVEPKLPIKTKAKNSAIVQHPLLRGRALHTIGHSVYTQMFMPEDHWELSEHRLMSTSLMPGTALIEMMVESMKREHSEAITNKAIAYTFSNIIFYSPFMVEDDGEKELHLLIENEADQSKLMRFASMSDDGKWDIHAEGTFRHSSELLHNNRLQVNIADLKETCRVPLNIGPADSLEQSGLYVSERWLGSFSKGWTNEQATEYVVELQLPQHYHAEQLHYHLHPALMDISVNSINGIIGEGRLFLPLSYGQLTVYGKLPVHVFVHLKKKRSMSGEQTHSLDIGLYDSGGNIVLKIDDYTIKSVLQMPGQAALQSNVGYVEQFHSYPVPSIRSLPDGVIVCAGKQTDLTKSLLLSLRSAGRQVIEITHKDNSDETWDEVLTALTHEDIALALFTWEPYKRPDSSPEVISNSYTAVLEGVQFLQAWSKVKLKAKAGIFALVSHGFEVLEQGQEKVFYPEQAALAGLWRVAALEFEQLQLRCIEHDELTTTEALLAELAGEERPTFVSYRKSSAYVPQMEPITKATLDEDAPLQLPEDGIIVISGGTGGLGIEVANFLINKGAKKIALLGYQQTPPREQWEGLAAAYSADETAKMTSSREAMWLELQSKLEVLEVLNAAVEDQNQVSAVLSKLRNQYGRISGVFHLAGRAGDGFLYNKSVELFKAVFATKAEGAYNLHLETLVDQPDCFVLFSSIASLFPLPGQGDYTAANMYLDAFARFRSQLGLSTISLQWPAWRETGMAKRMGAVDEQGAIAPLNTKEAIKLLEYSLRLGELDTVKQRTVWMPGKLTNATQAGSSGRAHIASLTKNKRASTLTTPEITDSNIQLTGVYEKDDIISAVAEIWSKTLALDTLDVDDEFNSLGGNSLLTSQMLREYNNIYPDVIDIADLFTYTTVRKQVDYLRSRIGTAGINTENQKSLIEEKEVQIELEEDIDTVLELLSRGEMTLEESFNRLTLEKSGGKS